MDPLHGLSCRQTGGRLIMRHNAVADAVVTALRKCGISPEVEPAGYDASDNRRPDIFAVINGRPTFIDVGIVHPSAPSHRSKKPLAAAEFYVKQKVDKYRQLAEIMTRSSFRLSWRPVAATLIKQSTSWTTSSPTRMIMQPLSPRHPFGMSSWTLSQ
jgi:hypothetical protein